MKTTNLTPYYLIRYIAAFIFILISANVFSSGVNAQLKFNSEVVKQIFQMIPEAQKSEIERKSTSNQGTHYLEANLSGEKRTVIYRYNKYNELEHIGLYLVNANQNTKSISEVFDYVERAFLVSFLLKEKSLLNQEIREKKIEVLYNGGSLNRQNTLSVLPKISINQNTALSIKTNPKFFHLEWMLENSNTLSVKIPNNYSLITGKTKDELERDLLREIKSSKGGNVIRMKPSKNELKPISQNIYLLQGEIYSTTPELSSSKYFMINDSIYPVFNIKYYKESVRNLFLNLVSTTLHLSMTQKLYGGNDEKLKPNVNTFLSRFNEDHDLYFGWQNDDKDNLKASVFISNKIYNYNHLLVITTNTKTIFRKNGEIDGLFFSYIPREIDK